MKLFQNIPFTDIVRFGQRTMLSRPLFSTSWILGRFCNYKCSSSSRNDETFVPAATKKNLNMMSAWTHVGGDTIRTISVLAAATVSMFSGIDGDICDAWAAIIVSLTILVMTVPLMIDIYTVACSFDDEQQGHSRGYSPIKTKEPIL